MFSHLQNFHLCFPVKNIFTSAQISLTILIPGFDTLTVSLCFLRCPKNIQVFCHPPPESTVFYAQCTHMIFVIYIHLTIFFISDPTPSSSCNTVFPRGVGWGSKLNSSIQLQCLKSLARDRFIKQLHLTSQKFKKNHTTTTTSREEPPSRSVK